MICLGQKDLITLGYGTYGTNICLSEDWTDWISISTIHSLEQLQRQTSIYKKEHMRRITDLVKENVDLSPPLPFSLVFQRATQVGSLLIFSFSRNSNLLPPS
jgi:hypothetical protein